MFTVGIFTTHIPYIAFVVFYAFFFLFGVNTTPVEEEVFTGNTKFNIELQSNYSFADVNAASNFHFQTDFDFSEFNNFEKSLFKRKINHQCEPKTVHWQYFLRNSLSNRPPPVFS